MEFYSEQKPVEPHSLGFYASGVWWRNKEKHQEFADGFFESEFLLIKHLAQFMRENTTWKLYIFLHPRERRTAEQLAEATAFYKKSFEGIPFEFGDFTRPTKSQFSLCDISISVCSNTTYERLYGGFKSLFAPYYFPNFPIPGSSLEQMCIKDYKSLESLIQQLSGMDTNEFFRVFGLSEYHHKTLQRTNEVMAMRSDFPPGLNL